MFHSKTFFILLLMIISSFLDAQSPIQVSVFPAPVSMDTQRSFVVVIPQTVSKAVEPDWINYLSKKSKGKSSNSNGEIIQLGVVHPNISASPFNVFSKLMDTNDGVRLLVWLDDRSLSTTSNSAQHLAIQKYVHDFAVMEYRQVVRKELKEAQHAMAKMESDLARLIRDDEKSYQTISENDRRTVKANDAMVTNTGDIAHASEKIVEQKDNVDRNAADPNALKGSNKTLDEMESDKKTLQRQNEKQGKSIDDMNKENREEERNLREGIGLKKLKEKELAKQKLLVQSVQDNLNSIR